MNAVVLLGSARKQSNMRAVLNKLAPVESFEVIDLLDCVVAPYNYETSAEDDFPRIVTKLTEVETIIFATPVYWYAMSGLMKTFFDRLSDLLGKPEGRALKGKDVYVVATGSDDELPRGFEVPFEMTSKYFGMNYRGARYKAVK